MNDKEGSGNVSLEGAMQILYLRYGRGLLDAQLEEIFGTSDLNSGKLLQTCSAVEQIASGIHSIQATCCCREDTDIDRVPAKPAFESDQAAT